MVRLLARVIGVGIETADMLVQEILSRNLRDRRAVARYGGLTGSPDESGSRRRVPEGRMRAAKRKRSGRATCTVALSRAGPHPALRATLSHASAREKGDLCVNLAPVGEGRDLLHQSDTGLSHGAVTLIDGLPVFAALAGRGYGHKP